MFLFIKFIYVSISYIFVAGWLKNCECAFLALFEQRTCIIIGYSTVWPIFMHFSYISCNYKFFRYANFKNIIVNISLYFVDFHNSVYFYIWIVIYTGCAIFLSLPVGQGRAEQDNTARAGRDGMWQGTKDRTGRARDRRAGQDWVKIGPGGIE